MKEEKGFVPIRGGDFLDCLGDLDRLLAEAFLGEVPMMTTMYYDIWQAGQAQGCRVCGVCFSSRQREEDKKRADEVRGRRGRRENEARRQTVVWLRPDAGKGGRARTGRQTPAVVW